jgi:toxin HigB-1
MAIKSFADQTSADIAAGINSKHARRIPQRVWTAAATRFAVLDSAEVLTDIALPAWRLEPLKHHRPGFYSIRVNDQYRILFRFEKGNAYDVEVADYHGGRR